MRGSPNLTPVTVSKLESMPTRTKKTETTFLSVFDTIHGQVATSPYDIIVGKWSVDDLNDEGFTMSKIPTVSYGRQFFELTHTASGKKIRVQIAGGSDFIEVRKASKSVKGDTWKVDENALKAYLVA